MQSAFFAALFFEERLGLMADRETAEREAKRLATRPKFADLRQNAVVEDIDLRTPRGIDGALFQKLAAGDWIDRAKRLLITGPTGVGVIRRALESAGVVFISENGGGVGVRLRDLQSKRQGHR